MPNWCFNKLLVQGPKNDVERFSWDAKYIEDDVKDGPHLNPLSLHSLFPEPIDEETLIKQAMNSWLATPFNTEDIASMPGPAWYYWRCHYWGTKWDTVDTRVEPSVDLGNNKIQLEYSFETAWSPPQEAFEKIARDFPSLSFNLEYCEPGMGYCGMASFNAGEQTKDIIFDEGQETAIGRDDDGHLINPGFSDAMFDTIVAYFAPHEWDD